MIGYDSIGLISWWGATSTPITRPDSDLLANPDGAGTAPRGRRECPPPDLQFIVLPQHWLRPSCYAMGRTAAGRQYIVVPERGFRPG